MGDARGRYRPGEAPLRELRRSGADGGPSGSGRRKLARDAEHRFIPEIGEPSAGDRFGELVVLGIERGRLGGVRGVRVQCSCGAKPHCVAISNLRGGKSTRCPRCARKAGAAYRKNWWGYASLVPDDGHRRRLCNRIAACVQRCSNPRDAGFHSYGGRGIRVFEAWVADRSLFLAHLVTLPGWDDPSLDLDRIDVDRGYEPGNLRFVTRKANCLNKRTVRGLQERVRQLEACLRHCTCGAAQQVHDPDG